MARATTYNHCELSFGQGYWRGYRCVRLLKQASIFAVLLSFIDCAVFVSGKLLFCVCFSGTFLELSVCFVVQLWLVCLQRWTAFISMNQAYFLFVAYKYQTVVMCGYGYKYDFCAELLMQRVTSVGGGCHDVTKPTKHHKICHFGDKNTKTCLQTTILECVFVFLAMGECIHIFQH